MPTTKTYAALAAMTQRRRPIVVALATLLILRSRMLELPDELISKLFSSAASGKQTSPEELARAVQQLYLKQPDGTKTLLVPYQGGISKVYILSSFSLLPIRDICIPLGPD